MAASGELEEPDAKRARKEPADEPGGASTPASTDSASTPAPAPAAGRAAGPAGDAPIATGSVSTPAPAPTKPAVPTAEARDTDTLAAMRGIIEYVQHHLHARLASHPQFVRTVALHEQQPLTIRAATPAVRELMSYKHPWTPDEAAQSLASTGRYEAGGNIMWLNPFTTVVNALAGSLTCSEAANAAGPAPTWESVHRMADQFRVSQDPASTRVETGRVAKEKRLLFRAPVQVHAPTLDTLTKPSFPGTLVLVSGHVTARQPRAAVRAPRRVAAVRYRGRAQEDCCRAEDGSPGETPADRHLVRAGDRQRREAPGRRTEERREAPGRSRAPRGARRSFDA